MNRFYIILHTIIEHIYGQSPLIPGVTTSLENIHRIGSFLAEVAGEIPERWELCAFNPLAIEKYDRLGMPWAYRETPLMSVEETELIHQVGSESFGDADRVRVTGLTAS